MTHKRKTIRDEVKRRLGLVPGVAGRVFVNRALPLFDQAFPLILLYTISDDIEKFQEAPQLYKRDLALGIEIVVGEPDDKTDDALDEVAEQVEAAMGAAMADYLTPPGGDSLLYDLQPGNSRLGLSEQGSRHFASLKMQFVATYLQALPGEETADALNDFNEAGILYMPAGSVVGDAVSDSVTFES